MSSQRSARASPCRRPSASATDHWASLRSPRAAASGARASVVLKGTTSSRRIDGSVHQRADVAGDPPALHRDLERSRQDPVQLQDRGRSEALVRELDVPGLQVLRLEPVEPVVSERRDDARSHPASVPCSVEARTLRMAIVSSQWSSHSATVGARPASLTLRASPRGTVRGGQVLSTRAGLMRAAPGRPRRLDRASITSPETVS